MPPPKNSPSVIFVADASRRFTPSPSFVALEKLGLFFTGPLVRNGDHNTRAVESINKDNVGRSKSKYLYLELNLLQEVYPQPDLRSDLQSACILRHATSVAQDKGELHGPVNKRNAAPPLRGLYIGAGWRPFEEAGTEDAEHLSSQQEPTTPAPEPKAVPIGETEQGQPSERVAHAIGRMYEHVTQHNEKVIRGAMTNGIEWEFIILHLNENGKGGGYKVSPPVVIESEPEHPYHVVSPGPDVVAAILAHWIPRCYEDLDGNDWFVADTA